LGSAEKMGLRETEQEGREFIVILWNTNTNLKIFVLLNILVETLTLFQDQKNSVTM